MYLPSVIVFTYSYTSVISPEKRYYPGELRATCITLQPYLIMIIFLSILATFTAVQAVPSTWDSLTIPAITLADLREPGNARYLQGLEPFLLQNATAGWEIWEHISPRWLMDQFGSEGVEYYPNGMHDVRGHPHLETFEDALSYTAQQNPSRQYVQWKMQAQSWDQLHAMMSPFPAWLDSEWWESRCLATNSSRSVLYRALSWRMMVIGGKDAGMFIHADNFNTSVWQIQLSSWKDWLVCKPEHEDVLLALQQRGDDPFAPDFDKYPELRKAQCRVVRIRPGDIIFYPSNWWHATRNGPWPSISQTGRAVTAHNSEFVYWSLRDKCVRPGPDASKEFLYAPPNLYSSTCQALPTCRAVWRNALYIPEQEISWGM